MRHYWLVMSVLIFTCAICAGRDKQPENVLDKLVIYSEITTSGESIPLSITGAGSLFPSRVPDNDEVDINSTIKIEVPRASGITTEPMASDIAELAYTLEKLYEDIQARIIAVESYNKTKKIKLGDLAGSASAASREFLESAGLAKYAQDSKYNAYFKDKTYQSLGKLLKDDSAAINSQLLSAEQSAKTMAGMLSFEAFVQPSKSSAYITPVHLPSYDNILNKEIERVGNPVNIYDVNTINRIDVMLKGTLALSALSEKIHRGEVSLKDALITAGTICFQRYAKLREKIQPVLDEEQSKPGAKLQIERINSIIADCDEISENWKGAGPDNLVSRLNEVKKLYIEFDVAASSFTKAGFGKIQEFMDSARALMSFASIDVVATGLSGSQVYEFQAMEAPDTQLEMQRTSRALNDKLIIKSTLRVSSSTYRSEATFIIKRFGWNTAIAPSAVLAKSLDNFTDNDKSFKIAPSVAWITSYYPRNYETGIFKGLCRTFGLGFGLHAILLDMDPNISNEFGIGPCLSFWEGRLLVGAGLNLSDQQRVYYYVGSNLLTLLNSLGVASFSSSGTQ